MKKLSDEEDFIFDVREDFQFYDEWTKTMGAPGYRNMLGKSGLGYIESVAEEARFEGQCVRWIFTGQFLTHNPIYLIVLFLWGMLFGVIPLLLIAASFIYTSNLFGAILLVPLAPYIAAGLAILLNVWRSISDPDGFSVTGD